MLTALALAAAVTGFRPANAEECAVYAAATGGRGGYNIASALTDLPGRDLIPVREADPARLDGPALALWPCGLPMGAPPLSQASGTPGYISRPAFNRRHSRAFVIVGEGCGSIVRIDLTRDRRGRWTARPSGQQQFTVCDRFPPMPPMVDLTPPKP